VDCAEVARYLTEATAPGAPGSPVAGSIPAEELGRGGPAEVQILTWLCFPPGGVMRNEFTAVFERDGSLYIAYCPEVPGANGQGSTKDEARENLAEAIALILEDRREDGLRGVPADAERGIVTVNIRGAA
jgi:predicted RNase H-like HicB family nuclease